MRTFVIEHCDDHVAEVFLLLLTPYLLVDDRDNIFDQLRIR